MLSDWRGGTAQAEHALREGGRESIRFSIQAQSLIKATLGGLPHNYSFRFICIIQWLVLEKNGTPAIDKAHPAGLVSDYIALIICPAPSCENTPVRSLAWPHSLLFSCVLWKHLLWSLWLLWHSKHMETSELASYSQARRFDVGVFLLDVVSES